MTVTSVREPLVIVPVDAPPPAYPVAVWMGGASVLGDATGGTSLLVIGPGSLALAVGYIWSLDGYGASHDDANAADWTAVWDPGWPQGAVVTRVCEWAATGYSNGATKLIAPHPMPQLMPLTHPVPRTAWSLTIRTVNADTRTQYAAGWGRCWAPDVYRKGGPLGYFPS